MVMKIKGVFTHTW